MGLSSEQVCEIGKWKNVSAFSSHYLRLGATNIASQHISELVHKVSPLGVAESDLTWTPGKDDPGGSVREDEARSNGEPTLPPFVFESHVDSHHLPDPSLQKGKRTQIMPLQEIVPNVDNSHFHSLENYNEEDIFFLDSEGDIVLQIPFSGEQEDKECPELSGLLVPVGQNVASSSASSFVMQQPLSPQLLPTVLRGKRPRKPGGSPPKKFIFAQPKRPPS
jgi:hypothetical protein